MADVLNYFALIVPFQHGRVMLPAWGQREKAISIALAEKGEWRVNTQVEGPLDTYSLKKLREASSVSRGLDVAEHILGLRDSSRTEIQDVLLTSMEWAGRASVATGREEALVLYSIALESLYLPDGNRTELRYRLGLRAAFFLGGTEERRQKIVDDVARLYKIRSGVVHSGQFEVTDQQVLDIRLLAIRSIYGALCTDDLQLLKTRKACGVWFERQIVR